MESRRKRLFCNTCERITWHELKTKFEHQRDPEQYDEMIMVDFAISIWEIWQCRGCDGIVVRNIEFVDDDELEEFYPPRSTELIKRQEFNKMPQLLDSIYDEVVKAFNSKCYILCSAGLRALLEAICRDRNIESGPNASGTISRSLEGKINGLKEIIPGNIVDNLHGLRFLGNKALHELDLPRTEDLALAIGVMETSSTCFTNWTTRVVASYEISREKQGYQLRCSWSIINSGSPFSSYSNLDSLPQRWKDQSRGRVKAFI